MSANPGIVLIGAGNVGSHLGRRLAECGLKPLQVFSRSEDKARALGEALAVPHTHTLETVRPDAGLYLLAVRDDSIGEVAAALSQTVAGSALVAHTSGATPSAVLAPYFRRYGVFYPLQTFTSGRPVDFNAVPMCIYAPLKDGADLLQGIARQISSSVHLIDDEQRAVLHIAAVFVNNFVNHIYRIGRHILEEERLHFELLLPLIWETARKVQAGVDPGTIQTGPAQRGDIATVQRHLQYLRKKPAYQALYRQLSASINPDLAI